MILKEHGIANCYITPQQAAREKLDYIPKPLRCKRCRESFLSQNRLFQHLKTYCRTAATRQAALTATTAASPTPGSLLEPKPYAPSDDYTHLRLKAKACAEDDQCDILITEKRIRCGVLEDFLIPFDISHPRKQVTQYINALRATIIPTEQTLAIAATWKELPKDCSFTFYTSLPSAIYAIVNHKALPAVVIINNMKEDIKLHRKQKIGNIHKPLPSISEEFSLTEGIEAIASGSYELNWTPQAAPLVESLSDAIFKDQLNTELP
ncbi:hypothetical protein B0J13DRAFT_529782 [Dactylonectria estremocensis]|uniref:C2H2-type domain-containing protein n=1 Tax=Dactylonectria estremocensis TaxID=1079267 RepID=A0A9P9E0E4_9HYPO|nr:hypothetical protein B0J13DRAFT_529782 [Dactylonectria estremocensis]